MKQQKQNVYEELHSFIRQLIETYKPTLEIEKSVFYMNANDGTAFDWYMNDRTCEFTINYKDSDYLFMEIWADKKGFIRGYVLTTLSNDSAVRIEHFIGVSRANKLKEFGLCLDAFHKWDSEVISL